MFGANWWLKPKFVMIYHADKPNFLEFWVKVAKITLNVKVNDLHFQHQQKISHDVCLVKIWWLKPKSVTSYCADNPNFLEFWVKMAEMTLKVKVNAGVNVPCFHYHTESELGPPSCYQQSRAPHTRRMLNQNSPSMGPSPVSHVIFDVDGLLLGMWQRKQL